MASEDLEGVVNPSLSNGDKSNGAAYSDCDQTDENLLGSPTVSDLIKSNRKAFGWCGYRPKCLQHLLSAKWGLFWMCWAGALQGNSIIIFKKFPYALKWWICFWNAKTMFLIQNKPGCFQFYLNLTIFNIRFNYWVIIQHILWKKWLSGQKQRYLMAFEFVDTAK